MQRVRFTYYNFKPRLRVDFTMKLHSIPMVGDFIDVRPQGIKEVSTKLISRETIKRFGKVFVVVKRTYNTKPHPINPRYKVEWNIELDILEPLVDIVEPVKKKEKRIDLSDLEGEYTLDEIPKVVETIQSRIDDAKPPKDYFKDYDEWKESFHCDNCGSHGMESFTYMNTYANGEVWGCIECNELIMVDDEPNQDDY